MKWGILATGTIARKFASTINAMKAEGESLAAVGSRSAESAKAFAAAYEIPVYHDSYEALASDPDVEAVYVATPNSMHFDNCRLCLENGKHVLCEKPFTINAAQAETLYRLADEKGLFILEGLWTCFLPLYSELVRVISSGEIGEVRNITCQYGFIATGARKDRKFNSALGGGALLDIGIYNLGFLQVVTGHNPVSFSTEKVDINEYGTDEYSSVVLKYADGCSAESIQTIGTELERNAVITGTRGRIFLPDFQHAVSMTVEAEGKERRTIELPFDINGFEYEIREASACVKAGRSFSSVYTPEDSIALTRLMYDIRMSWGMSFEGEA